jgi:N-acetylmuramoyl-L-alanine amidase
MALWTEDFVSVNRYTRPGHKLLSVRGIVVHYTATPGASAKNERNYFNGTCIEQKRSASAHLFVDKNEAILIMPLDEVAYHANEKPSKIPLFKATAPYYKGGNANLTTIGVEMCIEKDGSLHPETLKRTIAVVAELCKMFKLKETDIYRHYDITGKNCPAFWVSNPAGFEAFKAEVGKLLRDAAPKKAQIVAKPTIAPKPVVSKPAKPVVGDGKAIVPYPGRPIKLGSRGRDVERIQRAVGAFPIDGIFGKGTEAKVKAYQKRMGLVADGIVGPATWNMMF